MASTYFWSHLYVMALPLLSLAVYFRTLQCTNDRGLIWISSYWKVPSEHLALGDQIQGLKNVTRVSLSLPLPLSATHLISSLIFLFWFHSHIGLFHVVTRMTLKLQISNFISVFVFRRRRCIAFGILSISEQGRHLSAHILCLILDQLPLWVGVGYSEQSYAPLF